MLYYVVAPRSSLSLLPVSLTSASRRVPPLMHLPHSPAFTLSEDSQAGFRRLLSEPHFFVSSPLSACGVFGKVNYLMKFKSINVDVNYHTSAGPGLPSLCPGVEVNNGGPLLMTSIRLKGHLEEGRQRCLPRDHAASKSAVFGVWKDTACDLIEKYRYDN